MRLCWWRTRVAHTSKWPSESRLLVHRPQSLASTRPLSWLGSRICCVRSQEGHRENCREQHRSDCQYQRADYTAVVEDITHDARADDGAECGGRGCSRHQQVVGIDERRVEVAI